MTSKKMIKINIENTIILLLAMAFFYGMVFAILIISKPLILVDASIETIVNAIFVSMPIPIIFVDASIETIVNAIFVSMPILFSIFFLEDCISFAPRSNSPTASSHSFGEHNKDLTATQQVASQTSLNPDIKLNSVPNLVGGEKLKNG